ncbi:siderophore ferric iron reductase [Vibrio mytili]|uniref:(2Fe-2S)-binding protein n=1 Tax=Vibrio mytili TaxID=50718 RepID=A0A0C3DKI3_9VIBR|nr:siderophore ferric iron reductase [Vibrio mytili]KIN11969.1 (2Fe-2S)-binding protein [Vibrio mytili]
MSDSFFYKLFQSSSSMTAYLHGDIGEISQDAIHIDNNINPIIKGLYRQLEETYPEAGRAYWLTRTWDLLCWQPVYIAFISIYGFQTLPNLYQMAQYVKPCFVTGYRFANKQCTVGDETTLIREAGPQLRALFDFYQNEMNEWTRIRPGFTQQLMSDGMLAGLVRLQNFFPNLNSSIIKEHASLWLQAMDLEQDNVSSLYQMQIDQPVQLVRKSCCLVYKREQGKLCQDCPRLNKNREIMSKRV